QLYIQSLGSVMQYMDHLGSLNVFPLTIITELTNWEQSYTWYNAPGENSRVVIRQTRSATSSVYLDNTAYLKAQYPMTVRADLVMYRRALKRAYPLFATALKEQSAAEAILLYRASYALDYCEKICDLYTEHYNGFHAIGQKWIDAVRKCLQVALVPLLRPYNHPSCDEIKDAAFRIHSECYVSPYPGAPSFRDIGWSNYLKVYMTIKPAFSRDFWATVRIRNVARLH
ncbi:LOW QUALITY PROTEIN: hypothetical protein MAR_034458, partial [Mya arenaria]